MSKTMYTGNSQWRARLLLLVGVLSIGGCATQEKPRAQAQIEVQEAVGFTITEVAEVRDEIRVGYGDAMFVLEQGHSEEGIDMLAALAEQAPELSAPRIDLGIAHHQAGDLEAAERYLLEALELNPDHPVAHTELGIVYRKLGRFAEARQSYQAALAIYPGYHYARRNLAILCDLYLADLACALDAYEAYMETVPGDDEVAMWIADIRNRMNR